MRDLVSFLEQIACVAAAKRDGWNGCAFAERFVEREKGVSVPEPVSGTTRILGAGRLFLILRTSGGLRLLLRLD